MPTNSSVLWHAIACEQALRGPWGAVREGRESSPESAGAKGSEHEKTVGGGGGAPLFYLNAWNRLLKSLLADYRDGMLANAPKPGTTEHNSGALRKIPEKLVIQGLSRGCKFVFTPLT